MADYTQPDVVNKRVRFFDGQFLQDQDFIDEQRYHLDRERRQSRLLSVTGVVSGLTVTKSGAYQVTVAKGMAVDALGRQLVLVADLNLPLTGKFAKKQDIELFLVYQETLTDVAQTGGKSARRWDESPKVVALAPDGTVTAAPEGVSTTYEGPSVLLARLAVADNGDVTVDTTAARKAGMSVPGDIRARDIYATGRLEVSGGGGANVDLVVNGRLRSNNNDGGLWVAEDRFVGGHATNQIGFFNGNAWRLTVQPNGNVGIGTTAPENADGWNKVVDFLGSGNAKFSVRTAKIDARVLAHDSGFFGAPAGMLVGTKSNHPLSFVTNAATRLHINAAGNVGIGTVGPPWKLSVSSSKEHLALNREATETVGGAHVFLEIAQIDNSPARVPEVFPSIRFHHHNRFWHRIEARGSGLHFKTGNPAKNDYSDIQAANITASGKLNVTGGGGSNIDLVVNGRLQSDNTDGGLWVTGDRFVGGHATNQIGFFNGDAWRFTVQPNGNVGIGTTAPENAENWNKVVDFLGSGNAKFSVRTAKIDARVLAHDSGFFGAPAGMLVGTKSNHPLSFVTNAATRLHINAAGNVGIGTVGPPWKLSVSSSKEHLALYREATETVGGAHVFLELAQIDNNPARVPEVFPSIRFHHHDRFWHLIEGRGTGLHFKNGDPVSNEYSDIQARTVTSSALRIGSVTIDEHELSILKELAAGTLKFYLLNVPHNEYAYAASDPFKYDGGRRRIFTWAEVKGQRVSQGVWQIQPA